MRLLKENSVLSKKAVPSIYSIRDDLIFMTRIVGLLCLVGRVQLLGYLGVRRDWMEKRSLTWDFDKDKITNPSIVEDLGKLKDTPVCSL